MLIEQLSDHGLELATPSEGYVRTPGLHMSDLYNSLYKAINPKRYDKRDKDGKPLPLDEMACEMGTAFEEVIEPVIRRRVIDAERPGEYVTQHAQDCVYRRTRVRVGDPVCPCGAGVIYSPDHFLFDDDGTLRLGEFKCTKMSIRKGIRDKRFDKWFTQMKVYCYHLRTQYARLIACFINGDYTDMSYQVIPWNITFSEKEMFEEWKALLVRGRKDGLIPT